MKTLTLIPLFFLSLYAGDIADISRFSQIPSEYLQEKITLHSDEKVFRQQWFAPWHTSVAPERTLITEGMKRLFEGAYKENYRPYSTKESDALAINVNIDEYPKKPQKAISLTPLNVRALPSHRPLFADPYKTGEGYPFDYAQHSRIALSTPLTIWHESRDRAWIFVQTPYVSGWVEKNGVAFVDDYSAKALERMVFVTPLENNSRVHFDDNTSYMLDIGTLLVKNDEGVLLPRKSKSGFAEWEKSTLHGKNAPFPVTLDKFSTLLDALSHEVYDWGGGRGIGHDCSSTVRDVFAAIGIFLPRNSYNQAQDNPNEYISFVGLSKEEKKALILQKGKAGSTLLYKKGHIMLYVGAKNREPLIFHTMWGIRTFENGKEGRFIVGQSVITTLEPGRELKGWDKIKSSLLESLQGMRIIP